MHFNLLKSYDFVRKDLDVNISYRHPSEVVYIFQMVLIALTYYLAADISFSLYVSSLMESPIVFAAAGIALSAVIVGGSKFWLGVFFGQFAVALNQGLEFPLALVVAFIIGFEAVLGGYLFKRLKIQSTLETIRDVLSFLILIFFVLQPIGAVLVNSVLWLGGILTAEHFASSCFSVWLGNCLGQAIMTPLLLSLYSFKVNINQIYYKALGLLAIFIATYIVISFIFFFNSVAIAFATTSLFLILYAAQGSVFFVSLVILLITITTLYLTKQLNGPFVNDGHILLLDLNVFLLCLVITGLLVSALLMEYKKALSNAKESMENLERLASVDPLTGLFNRRVFLEKLNQEKNRLARKFNASTVLLMLDLDHFKQVNDKYGHRTGDLVLKTFSKIVLENIRILDVPARLGGEEFAILLVGVTKKEAEIIAERLRIQLANTIVNHDFFSVRVTVSIGANLLSVSDDIQGDIELDRADKALYDAKDRGRNQLCWFNAS